MSSPPAASVAVVGAGIAGAACAQALRLAGCAVHVFDKSRGPGGRLATRRLEWADGGAPGGVVPLDHGAVAFGARSAAFTAFVEHEVQAGRVAQWAPRRAEAGRRDDDDRDPLWVPAPDMPTLCRHLLHGVPATWAFAVDRLHRGPGGWRLRAAAGHHPLTFDTVVLALPPAQAAPLLQPHRPDWASRAAAVAMEPCWTLLGVARETQPAPDWGLARPPTGPLDWVVRNDARPGRERVPGQAHWVVHAHGAWSRRHLEQPADWVRQELQAALAGYLGRPIDWQHAAAHRWRYARPPAAAVDATGSSWLDDLAGLGVCGDFLAGRGVEGAWSSARALAAALAHRAGVAAGGRELASPPRAGVGADTR